MFILEVLGGSLGRSARWLSACVLLAACGDDSGSTPPPAGDAGLLGVIEGAPMVGDFDPDMNPPNDSGVMPEPDAAPNDDGAVPLDDAAIPMGDAAIEPGDSEVSISGVVLTNAPHIGFTNVGDSGLVITSAAFWTTPLEAGLAFVNMYGDVENHGTEYQCINSSELFSFDGGPDELVVIDSDPYRSLTSSITSPTDCIAPGGRGVWNGILLDMPVDFIERARQIRYDFSGLSLFDDYVPHELTPDILYADPIEREGGFSVFGQIRTADMPIYNMAISFFARHRNGLIYDDTNAYPNALATLMPNQSILFESYFFEFSDELPDSVTYFVDFLDGVDPTPNTQVIYDPLPEGELGEQIARVARAKRAHQEAREQAKAQLHR